jgi:hypothetical protein
VLDDGSPNRLYPVQFATWRDWLVGPRLFASLVVRCHVLLPMRVKIRPVDDPDPRAFAEETETAPEHSALGWELARERFKGSFRGIYVIT